MWTRRVGYRQKWNRDFGTGLSARVGRRPSKPDARGLHESDGYVSIGNFNGNPVGTFVGEKRLYG
jgi:hypothetical protein